MQQLKQDVSDIKKDVTEIKVTLGVNTQSLELHMKRTDQLEIMVNAFKDHMILMNAIVKTIIAAGSIILFLKELGLLHFFGL